MSDIILIIFLIVMLIAIVIYILAWLRVPFTLAEIKLITEQQAEDIEKLKKQLTRIEDALKKEK